MDANDLQAIRRVLFIPGPQLRDRVPAIDSTVSPELDQYDATAEVIHA